jgi:hypothetical protein
MLKKTNIPKRFFIIKFCFIEEEKNNWAFNAFENNIINVLSCRGTMVQNKDET